MMFLTILVTTLIHHTHNTTPPLPHHTSISTQSPHHTTTHHNATSPHYTTHHTHYTNITSSPHTTDHYNLNLITKYQNTHAHTPKNSTTASQQIRTARNSRNNFKSISRHSKTASSPQQDTAAANTTSITKHSITTGKQNITAENTNNKTGITQHTTQHSKTITRPINKIKRSIRTEAEQRDVKEEKEERRTRRIRARKKRRRRRKRRKGKGERQVEDGRERGRIRIKDLSLWIDENQVKMFSGYLMEIFVIHNSRVLPYILDPNFEKQLPVIPSQVSTVNFTWSSGSKKYQYTFEQEGTEREEEEEEGVRLPALSIPPRGTVPRKPTVFSVDIGCHGNISGTVTFRIGLEIQTPQGHPLVGTPLRLRLRKECKQKGPDPECDLKCRNGGVCDGEQQCQCQEGYMGQYCDTALCYPQCLNGGSCTTPGKCWCPPGFQGRHCEGGICANKCKNGGKCVQKDRCKCRRGYFGNWCQYSQCFVACINGGKCRGVNKCRCPPGYGGDHCEVVLSPGDPPLSPPQDRCQRRCQFGQCGEGGQCTCHNGYTGRWCRRRSKKGGGGGGRQRVWVR